MCSCSCTVPSRHAAPQHCFDLPPLCTHHLPPRHHLSLYAHISKITWQFDARNRVAGVVSDPDAADARPFSFDPELTPPVQVQVDACLEQGREGAGSRHVQGPMPAGQFLSWSCARCLWRCCAAAALLLELSAAQTHELRGASLHSCPVGAAGGHALGSYRGPRCLRLKRQLQLDPPRQCNSS